MDRFTHASQRLKLSAAIDTGAVGVYETGVLLDETHSWGVAFGVAAGMYAAGGIVYQLFYNASPLFPEGSVHADES
jgi:hypothetical protein